MKQVALFITLTLFLLPIPALATNYRSDNYQVIVTPAKEPAFSQPVVDLTNTPTGDFETSGFVQLSGWKNQGLGTTQVILDNHSLSAHFFSGGKVSAILWGDNRFGLEFKLGSRGRYQLFPVEEKLKKPVVLFSDSKTVEVSIRTTFEPVKRGPATNSELKYFFVPNI